MKPKRIQRKRTRGWKMPTNTVYVGRPTLWGNPFFVNDDFWGVEGTTPASVVLAYELWLKLSFNVDKNPWDAMLFSQFLRPLRGKNLACWCPLDQSCHADVLLRLANE